MKKTAIILSISLTLFSVALQAQETNKSLENAIIKTITAYFNKDEETLNSLIHKDFGIAFLYRRGAIDNASVYEKFSFNNPVPEYLPYDTHNMPTDFTIHFEELPIFCCYDWEWSKPHGIYIDTINIDKSLSRIAKFEKKHSYADWSACDIKRFEEMEKKSHKVIVAGKSDFVFWLTLIEDKCYLTIIDRFEVCSA